MTDRKSNSVIDRRQCRAARDLLEWQQKDLAEAAGVTLPTISNFETGTRLPHPNNLAAIRAALEKAGVKFIDAGKSGGVGVRLND